MTDEIESELERLEAKRVRYLNLAKMAEGDPPSPINVAMKRASIRRAIEIEGQIDRLRAGGKEK